MLIPDCKAFKDKIEEITEAEEKDNGESKEGTTAASLLEKLSVEEKLESKDESSAGEKQEDKNKPEKPATEE